MERQFSTKCRASISRESDSSVPAKSRKIATAPIKGLRLLPVSLFVLAAILINGSILCNIAPAFDIAEGFMKQGDFMLATGDTAGASACYEKAVKLLPPNAQLAEKARKTLEAIKAKLPAAVNSPAGGKSETAASAASNDSAVPSSDPGKTASASAAKSSGIDERIVGLDEESLGMIPEEVRTEFLDHFNRGVESLSKGDFSTAISLFDSIRPVSSHPGTQARINYLLALCYMGNKSPADAVDNYIAAVLSDRMIDAIADEKFSTLVKKEIAELTDNREKGEETTETRNRRLLLRAFSAYATKKDEFAAKEASEVKVGSLSGIVKGNFVKLLANLKQSEDRDRAKMAVSPLLASLEKKADDNFRRGRFEEAVKQYETIASKMPDDKMMQKKLEVSKKIVADMQDGKVVDKSGDFSLLADTELNALNFAAMTEAREMFKKLVDAIGKERYSAAAEAVDRLNALSLPPVAKSKVKYHEAICLNHLGRPAEAGMAYVEALLLNRSVLGVEDHGVLGTALEKLSKEEGAQAAFEKGLLSAVQAVVNTNFVQASNLCRDLVTKASASNDHKTILLAQWLSNIIDKELGLDSRIVTASAASARGPGQTPASNQRTSTRQRGGRRVTDQPQAPLLREGKEVKEYYRHKIVEGGERGDMDGDGIVGPQDVKLIRQVIMGKYQTIPEVVKAADITGDGVVNQADFEFAVWSVNGYPGDTNGDKEITQDELDGMYSIISKLSGVNLDDLYEHERIELQKEIDKYDCNKDGKVDHLDHRIMTQTFSRIFVK